MKISIIGFGNMARAIAHGLLRDKGLHLYAASPSLSIGVNHDGVHTHFNNQAIIPNADVVILAVKPAHMEAVLTEIKPLLSTNQLVISVAAGLTLDWFLHNLPKKIPLIRAIPNLAARYGQSATPLIANDHVSSIQIQTAERVFLSNGIITWASNESELDAFTALSGSGPAYFFAFINAMVEAGVFLGLPEDIAHSFAIQTAEGAVTLAKNGNQNLISLQKAVTSKGGTTEKALDVFQNNHLNDIVLSAMTAAFNRSKEISGNI